ncbi:MAG: HAD family phosphatase [Treponema sp.]|jgi:HAD superfamily hydrolase (TIGR01509 family)|nr:HAD family phosphatase [Treponema sp.]
MTISGVIFDMDGLMLDTERLEIGLYARISGEMGWPTAESFLRSTLGISDAAAEFIYKAEYGPSYPFEEIWERVKEEETELGNREGLPLRPGLLTLLDKLGALKMPLAVATSTERDRAKWKLSRGGIPDRFAVLACGDEVLRGKPEPDIFLLAAERLGLDPASCVGFEDSPAGLAGLAKAGIRPVFVKDLAEPPPEVRAQVWREYDDLAGAVELFG